MNADSLSKGLKTKIIGKKLFFFDQTDSTNNQAKIISEQNSIIEGTTIVTARQTAGKGTDDNIWISGKDNLTFSVIFKNDNKVTTLFPLYPAVALTKTLRKKYHIAAHVKWPNDVLIGNKKIAGILCEGMVSKYMIVGIGININETTFPASLEKIATSMQIEKQKPFLLEEVFQYFLLEYENLLFGSFDIRQEWLDNTLMIGKQITAFLNGKEQKVTVTGISKEGFLQIKTNEGHTESWMARRGLDIKTDY